MKAEESPLFLYGAGRAFHGLGSRLADASAVAKALELPRAVWVASAGALIRALPQVPSRRLRHRLLLTNPVSHSGPERLALLRAYFLSIVAPDEGPRILPDTELAEVLGADHPADYFVGGLVDFDDKVLLLYRGNLEPLIVPFAWFRPATVGPKPDFRDFEVIDCGQTVRLGRHEAAADALLYEFCPESRRRMKARALEMDRGIGGAIRRLRLQKGISRVAFVDVGEKTLSRIERGEVRKPRPETVERIARRLGVSAKELATY